MKRAITIIIFLALVVASAAGVAINKAKKNKTVNIKNFDSNTEKENEQSQMVYANENSNEEENVSLDDKKLEVGSNVINRHQDAEEKIQKIVDNIENDEIVETQNTAQLDEMSKELDDLLS